jgi:hypothetical protein
MNRFALCGALLLAACADKGSQVRITDTAAPAAAARSEPVLYNGRNYLMAYTVSNRVFDVKVSGVTRPMKGGDKQDALNITTSSVRYFGCRDKQTARILGAPRFDGGTWRLQARCA